MRLTVIPASILVFAFSLLAPAQTKVSGTVQCGKPDDQHSLDVGDRPNHSFSISKGKCTWTKPMEIAGTQTKEDDGTNFDEITGDHSTGRGYVVAALANGDKMYVRIQSSATMKEGKLVSGRGTWSFTGGTGKVKGITGKGTYQGKAAPDGTVTYDVTGEYQLPK